MRSVIVVSKDPVMRISSTYTSIKIVYEEANLTKSEVSLLVE